MSEIFRFLGEVWRADTITIDNDVFRLHYKVTVFILCAFFLFVTSNQYVGDPIDCIIDEIPSNVMDTYCWIYGTYTFPNKLNGIVGRDIVQPGVASDVKGEDKVKFHKYYQWIYFAFLIQAVLFYTPRYLWKTWEGNRVKALTRDLNNHAADAEYIERRKEMIINSIHESFGRNNFYVYRLIVCEVLNLNNVLSQMLLMDLFLGGEFSTYGFDVLNMTEMEPEMRRDPMSLIFPKVTKCTFHKYGPSGSIQKFDGLCILPLNIINEKIYLFLWFWFVFLSILSCLALVYRAILLCIPKTRLYVLRARTNRSSYIDIGNLLKKCQIGDWFILYQISKNIDEMMFKEILSGLNSKINKREMVEI